MAQLEQEMGPRLGQALLLLVVFAHSATPAPADAGAFLGGYTRANVMAAVGRAPTRVDVPALFAVLDEGYAKQAGQLTEFVEAAWQRLTLDEPLGGPLDTYLKGARDTVRELRALCDARHIVLDGKVATEWNQCIERIGTSLMHMTNNRLGLTRYEEAYIGRLAARALERIASTGVAV